MQRFTTRKRRASALDPGARGELSSQLWAALPPRFEAVGEALASGSGTVVASEVAGAARAGDGVSLPEALDALATTARMVCGTDPDFADTRAMAVAWSDAMLGYLNGLSCEDPLTGLASLAHLRSRVADLYRAGGADGVATRESHALVVVSTPASPGPGAAGDALARAMREARLGETARTVFAGTETISRLAPGRLAVLADRDERIGRRVGLLRTMLDGRAVGTRVWIEGLPDTDVAAVALLDELTRV